MTAAKEKTTFTAAEVAYIVQSLQAIIQSQQEGIEALKRKLGHMNEVFANAQRTRFGQSSEKASYVMGEGQISFFNEAKDLPVEEALLELPEEQLICGKCGGKFKAIGKKYVRREMQVIPRQVKILEYYTVTYACDRCEKDTGFAHIVSVRGSFSEC